MRILYATSEAAPFCKTGGLADVLGALPLAMAQNSEDQIAVVMPLYGQISQQWREKMHFECYIYVDLSWRHQYCGLFRLDYAGVTWYFVDNENYFRRESLYGAYDDGERFAFFSKAVVDLLPSMNWMPEVIHCNDWQTALVPVYLKDAAVRWEEVRQIRTVFTIHNIEYQGRFGDHTVEDLFGLNRGWWDDGTLRHDHDVNLMKAAMMVSDYVTTVSPTYAQQLKDPYYAHGMETVVEMISGKLSGVLNGIDAVGYNPMTDPALCVNYGPRKMAGKAACKKELQEALGLHVQKDVPVISMVTRMVGHKGMDLVCQVFDRIMETGVQFVILGTGEKQYEDFFRFQASRYPGRVAAQILYSESLSRRIYAGSDLFLMPSKSEPCGLSQMIAMRYGAVPVVRRTGGLNDSVPSCQAGQSDGTGFVFDRYDAEDMLNVISQAETLYRQDAKSFAVVQKRGMNGDFSWKKSAGEYRKIYTDLIGG